MKGEDATIPRRGPELLNGSPPLVRSPHCDTPGAGAAIAPAGRAAGALPRPRALETLSQREAHGPSDTDSDSGDEPLTADPHPEILPDETRLVAIMVEGAVEEADPCHTHHMAAYIDPPRLVAV